jgi:hypothetical protein
MTKICRKTKQGKFKINKDEFIKELIKRRYNKINFNELLEPKEKDIEEEYNLMLSENSDRKYNYEEWN